MFKIEAPSTGTADLVAPFITGVVVVAGRRGSLLESTAVADPPKLDAPNGPLPPAAPFEGENGDFGCDVCPPKGEGAGAGEGEGDGVDLFCFN